MAVAVAVNVVAIPVGSEPNVTKRLVMIAALPMDNARTALVFVVKDGTENIVLYVSL